MSTAPKAVDGFVSTVQCMTSKVLRPPIDKALLPCLDSMKFPESCDLKTLRGFDSQTTPSLDSMLRKFPNLTHAEYTIPGPKGEESVEITLSVFTESQSASRCRPGLYMVHGGGQIAGNRFTGLEVAASFLEGLEAVLVAVEYRLSPEHPAPAALNDSYAGLVWVGEHLGELGIDPERLMIMGCSGGGPIAAGSAMLARNNNFPKLAAQMLATPMLDDRNETISAKQYMENSLWNGRTNIMAWDLVLGKERGGPNVNVGEAEVFRDESVAYASLLWECGVSTELHVWQGGFHAFDWVESDAPVARAARNARVAWMRRTFAISE